MRKELQTLRGRFRSLFLYDVAEAFDLEKLRDLLGPRGDAVWHVFPRRTPEYIRFEHAPIVERGEPIVLSTGEELLCSIKYYAFAVMVVQLEIPFACGWTELASQTARWMDDVRVETQARQLARWHLDKVSPAVIRPNSDWLVEDYLVIDLQDFGSFPVTELLAENGQQLAQIVRGESVPLAPRELDDILQAALSYSPMDLVIVEASAALVYDRSEDATATIQVLEYAKMQLLEFRYYDSLMTQLLSSVYDVLEAKRNILFQRWSLPREAQRFNTIRLDVMELTERVDNAIKFVSDVYYARVYRLAANRIGLPGYRDLVDEKLRTAGELYDFMVDQFNEARSFVLELSVAILVLVDVILLLRGR